MLTLCLIRATMNTESEAYQSGQILGGILIAVFALAVMLVVIRWIRER